MPISAQQERQLLNHYKLTNLYPDAWPHPPDADDEDDSSDEDEKEIGATNGGHARHSSKPPRATQRVSSSSKFRNIDRHASVRSAASLGPDSVVQKDEPDPLGMTPSVAAELRRRGLPVEEDLALRNRFMLSSTSFSPALFLAQVHQDASTEDLLRGLGFLSRSIEQKSASLKVLVESNFDKFVRAKGTIDNVYTEMRTQGADDPQPPSAPPTPSKSGRRSTVGQHSRHTSRGQTHFRNASGAFSSTAKNGAASDKKKNALTKESEYGVLGIKAPLQDLAIKAEEVWGPALGGREKEESLKSVLATLDQHKDIFRLPGVVDEAVKTNDYPTVIASWKAAQRYADQARQLAASAQERGVLLQEPEAQQILVTAKMHHDVSNQVSVYKRDIWRRLKTSHGRKSATAVVGDEPDGQEEHMEFIGVLLQLGVGDEDDSNSPIWEWLHSRYLYLKDRIARSFERARIEIEIKRRRLAANDRQDAKMAAAYLRSAATSADNSTSLSNKGTEASDTPPTLAFWDLALASLQHLLETPTGVVGELLEWWETTQSFIDGTAQKVFPAAVFATGLAERLELEPDDVANLRAGAAELVEMVREGVYGFFAEAPVEDLSELYSPVPPTPISPDQGTLTPTQRTFRFDLAAAPPPSPKRGEPWEKFAFWAPHANALSASHYLALYLSIVGKAATELASLSVIRQSRSGTEGLKSLVGAARERCVQALCASWTTDAGERFKYTEEWVRAEPERRDLTRMPEVFRGFEEKVLAGFQRVAFVSQAEQQTTTDGGRGAGGGSVEVVMPPPAKLLQAIRGSFVTSLYKVMSGMVENAEKGPRGGADGGGLVLAAMGRGRGAGADGGEGAAGMGMKVDAGNRNIRMLMTLSNLAHLRADIIPHLIGQFEAAFAVKLTEESKTIRDVLGQIDARLFQSYVQPTVEALNKTIAAGVRGGQVVDGSNTGGGRPTDARPYVYEVLLTLVLVHAEVSATASGLTNQILSYLLEQASQALLTAFSAPTTTATATNSTPAYTLPLLMQATLDVEFLAQTLNNYTTDRAGEVQSQIYLALDERTDDEARTRLQGELPGMRGVLKRLREGTKGEFGCFRRERRGREGRAGTGTGGGSSRG